MWCIKFKIHNECFGAEIDGNEATVYWNGTEPRKKILRRPMDFQTAMYHARSHITLFNAVASAFGPETAIAMHDLEMREGPLNWNYNAERSGVVR